MLRGNPIQKGNQQTNPNYFSQIHLLIQEKGVEVTRVTAFSIVFVISTEYIMIIFVPSGVGRRSGG